MAQRAILSDREVLLKIRSADQMNSAISYLYQHYYGRLEALIRRNSGSMEDAQDIIQETMIAFVNMVRQDRFRGEAAISTFLHAIARNLWLDRLRKNQSEWSRIDKWAMEADEFEDLERNMQHKEATDMVAEIFKNLGEGCQKLLHLFYFREMSMREILPEMNYENEQVLRNKKAKCMKMLLEKVKAEPQWANHIKIALQQHR